MANYAILRWEKIKSFGSARNRNAHATREKEQPFEKQEIVNPKIYIGERPASYRQFVKERLQGNKIRKNAVVGLEFVLTFSNGAVKEEELKKWAMANLHWVCDKFGGIENLYSANLHLHESTPHIHIQLAPIHENKLNCKHFIPDIERMRELQDSYAKAMEPFGLERGISRDITRAYHTDFKTYKAKQLKELDDMKIELQQEKMSIERQKEIVKAVNQLMDEDLDFRIQVHSQVGKNLVPDLPEPEISRQKKQQHNLDHDAPCR